jgi:hypothetical protein
MQNVNQERLTMSDRIDAINERQSQPRDECANTQDHPCACWF